MDRLECLFCAGKFPLNVFAAFCPRCHEPMVVSSTPRKKAFALDRKLSLEKYQSFLPLARVDSALSLGEGDTPLIPLERIRQKHHLPPVYAKNETVNPTQSFKDRGTAVAVQKAVALGIRTIGTLSTGNMAGSTAAYGAKAGLKTVVLLKEDTPEDKIRAAGVFGPVLIKVRGDYGELFARSLEIGGKHGIYFMNSIDPLRIEGYKVTGFEIFHQLAGRIPRYIFVPASSGGHLIGLMRAFLDLKEERLSADVPIFVGVQAKGCSPIARAYAAGKDRVTRFRRAETIAHAISNPAPPGGNLTLKLVRENRGLVMAVTDPEILTAQRELAELEGIFADPASATVLAALIRLSRRQRLSPKDEVVLVITGSGLKSMETTKSLDIPVHKTSVSRLEQALQTIGV
ncbi:MAG: threonine synthase [Candidatus Aminicenantes bacterium]|nr:threonine synthase [Candidatus Aminicenantes bacterium]